MERSTLQRLLLLLAQGWSAGRLDEPSGLGPWIFQWFMQLDALTRFSDRRDM